MLDVRMMVPISLQGKKSAVPRRGPGLRKNPETRIFEDDLLQAFAARWPTPLPVWDGGPLVIDMLFVLPRPSGRSPRAGRLWADVKPDKSNIVKSIEDALLGRAAKGLMQVDIQVTRTERIPVALPDDAAVVMGRQAKIFGDAPRVSLHIYEAPRALPAWAQELADFDPLAAVFET